MTLFFIIIAIAVAIGVASYFLLPSKFGDSVSGRDTSELNKGEAVNHDIRKTEMMARMEESNKGVNGPSQGNW